MRQGSGSKSSTSRRVLASGAAIAALVAGAILTSPAQAIGPTLGTYATGDVPDGIAITGDGSSAYVANNGTFELTSSTVTRIDLATGISSTIAVGARPQAVVLNAAETKVFVSNYAGSSVSVISTATNTVTKTISVAAVPYAIAFNPAGTRAYVSHYSAAGVIDVIDTATETTLAQITGAPTFSEGLAVSPDGLTLYATGSNDDRLYLINLLTGVVNPTSYLVGEFPTSVAVSPSGARVYVVNESGANSTVSVFDTATSSIVDSIPVGDFPLDIVISQDGERAYVTNEVSDTISVIDLATENVIATLPTGDGPHYLALSDDRRTLVVTNSNSDSVSRFTLEAQRVAGTNRYTTAVAISQESFPSPASVPAVFIATGTNYPDALATGPVAARAGGPLLLTAPDALPGEVATEVARLNPAKIYVVGGLGAVSAAVFTQLAGIQSNIERIQGANRYETGRNVVGGGYASASEVWIATGQNFPDALSAGAVGAATDKPVILVNGSELTVDAATISLIDALNPTVIKIAGGFAAVSSEIESQLALEFPTTTIQRFSGLDRYTTSIRINRDAFDLSTDAIFATGASFPDALAGAPYAGRLNSPLIVVRPDCIPAGTLFALEQLLTSSVTLLGGPAALNESAFALTECAS